MNILCFSSYNLYSHRLGIILNEMQNYIDNGANVYFISCHNTFNGCGQNMNKKRSVCSLCKSNEINLLKYIEGKFITIKISDLITNEDVFFAKAQYEKNVPIKKDTIVDGFDIGESLYSSYISSTKNLDEGSFNKTKFSKFGFENSLLVYSAVKKAIHINNIDRVILFNGRWDYYRAAMRAAINLNKDVYTYEIVRRGDFIKYNKNDFPHNFKFNQDLVDAFWSNSEHTLEEKLLLGAKYYEGKRSGDKSIDRFAYSTRAVKGLLPDGFDFSKKNYVFFNNSDFEFSALSKEYIGPIFENQIQAIDFLVEIFGNKFKDKTLYVRLHPNLMSGPEKYISELMAFDKLYNNVVFIHPSSTVSSYSLVDNCNFIITYRSTIGVEACYSGKPVITIGKSFYQFANVSYNPTTKEELILLIEDENLLPKPIENAKKWGYFILYGGVGANFFKKEGLNQKGYFKGEIMYKYTFFQKVTYYYYLLLDKLMKK